MSGLVESEVATVGHVARQILKEEGVMAFFSGVSSRLMHKIPANGVFFLFYELFRGVLGVKLTGQK